MSGPTGTTATRWIFRDGQPVVLEPLDPEIVLGPDLPDQHLDISLPWSVLGALRTGAFSLLESLLHADGVAWSGRWSTPLLVRGLLEGEVIRAHDRDLGFLPPIFDAYARLVNEEVWQTRLRPLTGPASTPSSTAPPVAVPGYQIGRDLGIGTPPSISIAVPLGRGRPPITQVNTLGDDAIVERLGEECDEGLSHTGGRIVCVVEGEVVLDVSAGVAVSGADFDERSISSVYCAAKPAIAATVARLIADGELSADDALGDLVDGLPDWLARVEVEWLLVHATGLHTLDRAYFQSLPLQHRRSLLTGAMPTPGFRCGVDSTFCEVGSWHLVAEVIEAVTGREFDLAARDLVLRRYGIDDDDLMLRIRPEDFARLEPLVSMNVDAVSVPPVPVVSEAVEAAVCEPDPVFGPYGNAAGIAGIWRGILADFRGAGTVLPPELAAKIVEPTRPPIYDDALEREAAFGWGSLTPPAPGLARWIGHGAEGGVAFGAVCLEHDTVIAAVYNGCVDRDLGLTLRAGAVAADLERLLSARAAAQRPPVGHR